KPFPELRIGMDHELSGLAAHEEILLLDPDRERWSCNRQLASSGTASTLPGVEYLPSPLLDLVSHPAVSVVVIDQTHRLHERVCRRGSDEGPSPPLQVARQRDRTGRRGRNHLGQAPKLGEATEVGEQRAGFRSEFLGPGGVVDGRADLSLVADDAGIVEEAGHVGIVEAGHLVQVESCEGLAERGPLSQDRQPGQTRLKPFQAQLLEEPVVFGDRKPPLGVVVVPVEGRFGSPGASLVSVLAADRPVHRRQYANSDSIRRRQRLRTVYWTWRREPAQQRPARWPRWLPSERVS